jgi:hypothetical protein
MTPPTDLVPDPLAPIPDGRPAAGLPEEAAENGNAQQRQADLVQRVLVAAGEVEEAEWALDQVLDAAATSGEEIGLGFDVAPVDGALESARWALDQAVAALHADLRTAADSGVPLTDLAEASGLHASALRTALDAASDTTTEARPAGQLRP